MRSGRAVFRSQRERLPAVLHRSDVVALGLEALGDAVADAGVVLDEEYGARRRHDGDAPTYTACPAGGIAAPTGNLPKERAAASTLGDQNRQRAARLRLEDGRARHPVDRRVPRREARRDAADWANVS